MRVLIFLLLLAGPAVAADQCLGVDPKASVSFGVATAKTSDCHVWVTRDNVPLPDPACTPGAVNPTVTADILRDPAFRTRCVRDGATSPEQKRSTYGDYKTARPAHNSGKRQTCEIDHLVSLELGGADTFDNLWPQCGGKPAWFRIKDKVENYLAAEVKAERMTLEDAQHGLAEDWSRYIPAATAAVPNSVPQRPGRRSKPRLP
jgi:hypothetical protein